MYLALVFILGTCLGSFVPCLAHQLVFHHFSWRARSTCDHCQHPLAWYDLIPLLSQWLLGFRCRYCHRPLSLAYCYWEVAGGLLALGVYLRACDQAWSWPRLLATSGLLLLLALMAACDGFATWVPNRLQVLMFPLALYLGLLYGWSWPKIGVLTLALLGLCLIQMRHPDGLGGADIKLLANLWLSLPMAQWPLLLGLASGLGLLAILWRGRARWHQPLPFVPAIALAYYGLLLWP